MWLELICSVRWNQSGITSHSWWWGLLERFVVTLVSLLCDPKNEPVFALWSDVDISLNSGRHWYRFRWVLLWRILPLGFRCVDRLIKSFITVTSECITVIVGANVYKIWSWALCLILHCQSNGVFQDDIHQGVILSGWWVSTNKLSLAFSPRLFFKHLVSWMTKQKIVYLKWHLLTRTRAQLI